MSDASMSCGPGPDDPTQSRVFIVCGKAAEADMLLEAFSQFGTIQSVKVVKDKGVAYVKYDKASSAALAIETMHETVLNDGRGPMLKVMLAEAPSSRRGVPTRSACEPEPAPDPDNIPPRSRLFIVVPKTADGQAIEDDMARFSNLQYCKSDLIASKGIVFCKYAKASSALRALEAISDNGMVAGYKVKCMLAEPKSKRGRTETSAWSEPPSPGQQGRLEGEFSGRSGPPVPLSPIGGGSLRPAVAYSPTHSGNGLPSSMSESRTGSGQLASTLTSGLHPPHHQHSHVHQHGQHHAHGHGHSHQLGSHFNGHPTHTSYAGHGSLRGAASGYAPASLGQQARLGMPGMGGLAHHSSGSGLAGLGHLHGSNVCGAAPGIASGTRTAATLASTGLSMGDYTSLGALGGLANLQAIAANLVSANLAQANPLLASSMDLLAANKQWQGGMGGLGGLVGMNPSVSSTVLGNLGLSATPQPLPANSGVTGSSGRGAVVPSGSGACIGGPARLYVVVHKAAGEELLLKMFRSFPGFQRCDLKRDHVSGLSRGFCYVSYATTEAAAAALEALNGCELPPHSGQHMKVMWAEAPGAPRRPSKGTPPLAPSRSLSMRSDSNDSILQRRSLLGEEATSALGALGSENSMAEAREHRVEVAAVQNSLAHMSMPRRDAAAPTPPAPMPDVPPSVHKAGRRQPPLSPPESEVEWEAESPAPDERLVYTMLTRPLPSYALEHFFAQHGPVDSVVLRADERYGVVRFRTPDAARAALDALHGTQVCGEALSVLAADPLAGARFSKRPRVAE